MKRQRNWFAIGGLVAGISGVVVYFLLVLTTIPAVHRWLEMPVGNLALIAAGLVLSCIGVVRAASTRRARIVASGLALVNLSLAGAFAWWLFSFSYAMPAAAHAPAVGAAAPDFELPDERGNQVRLSALRGKPVVLLFYRGFW